MSESTMSETPTPATDAIAVFDPASLATKTVLQLRAMARAACECAGYPSSWTAGGRRADLETYLLTGVMPVGTSAPGSPVPTAPAPIAGMPVSPPIGDLAGALAAAIGGATSGAVDSLRADVNERLRAIESRVDSIPGGVADAVAKIADVESKIAALGDLSKIAGLAADLDARRGVRLPVLAAAAAAPDGPLARLLPFYSPGQSNGGTVVCLTSPPSYGKSFAVRRLGENYDAFLEHPCTADMDETARLLGTVAPDGRGGFVTVDGSLTEAVRRAAAGESVLLFLDEVFRLAQSVAETLLTFLVPRGSDYVLRTRRPTDSGAWETLRCPVAQLHIVCAANLTASVLGGLACGADAFWSRLHIIRLPWSAASAAATASAILASYGIDDVGGTAAQAFARAMGEARAARAGDRIAVPLDFRTLERACRHASTSTRGDVLRFAAQSVVDQLVSWHPDTGDALPASVEAATAIARILSL